MLVALALLFGFVVYLIYGVLWIWLLLIDMKLVACCYLGLLFGCVFFSWFMVVAFVGGLFRLFATLSFRLVVWFIYMF